MKVEAVSLNCQPIKPISPDAVEKKKSQGAQPTLTSNPHNSGKLNVIA